MNISKAAALMELTPVTLRYYERVGLIPPVERKNGGVREYHQDDINWIEFIKCMRSAGLSIESLIEYTNLFQQGDETIDARKQILMAERDQLLSKYQEIGKTLDRLDCKIQDYEDGKFLESERRLADTQQAVV